MPRRPPAHQIPPRILRTAILHVAAHLGHFPNAAQYTRLAQSLGLPSARDYRRVRRIPTWRALFRHLRLDEPRHTPPFRGYAAQTPRQAFTVRLDAWGLSYRSDVRVQIGDGTYKLAFAINHRHSVAYLELQRPYRPGQRTARLAALRGWCAIQGAPFIALPAHVAATLTRDTLLALLDRATAAVPRLSPVKPSPTSDAVAALLAAGHAYPAIAAHFGVSTPAIAAFVTRHHLWSERQGGNFTPAAIHRTGLTYYQRGQSIRATATALGLTWLVVSRQLWTLGLTYPADLPVHAQTNFAGLATHRRTDYRRAWRRWHDTALQTGFRDALRAAGYDPPPRPPTGLTASTPADPD